ncbi:T9SS type A sorting domain-containing protein [uncultured Winogradskyella sp.]|uniref:T9SS type A sorting domain-containing protein n=1 Tax=uncultured Winogradskyella sp. TaxID=395353 RepID=UPI002620524E|nr:T9SS type A sorting domain-containing protein [uncultured Winogradskyella sp.]
MKKITLLFIFCLAFATISYGQCTTSTGGQWPASAVTLANTGGEEAIASNNWPNAEFSVIEGVQVGSDYTVTATPSMYITVTNTSDGTVIGHGAGSVSFTAGFGVTGITIFWHLDAACGTQNSGNTVTTIQCTSCVCSYTVAPNCVTEISPVDADPSATVGTGGAVTFEWNTDPDAESYELFINNFSQGSRESGVTFTGFDYGTAYTWQVVPTNCFAAATGCATWSFTTEACAETAAPSVPATAPSPADGATAVAIEAPDGTYDFSWTDSGSDSESYTLNIGTSNPPTTPLENFPNGGTITGLAVNTTYFWSIDVTNCIGTTTGTSVWSFTTDTVLGVEDNFNTNETFAVYPNPTSGLLNIKSSQDVDSVTVFNLLGQSVASYTKNDITNSSIDMSDLSQGLYLVKITSGENTQTVRVTKD